jgi:hypothetical protein
MSRLGKKSTRDFNLPEKELTRYATSRGEVSGLEENGGKARERKAMERQKHRSGKRMASVVPLRDRAAHSASQSLVMHFELAG